MARDQLDGRSCEGIPRGEGSDPGVAAGSERHTWMMGSGGAAEGSGGDVPWPSASDRDWGQHLITIFETGFEVAQALHAENKRLLQRVVQLEAERGAHGSASEVLELRAQLAALSRERNLLEHELMALKRGVEDVRQENCELADRYINMERQNSNFISLYVASTQLHSTLEHGQVLRNIAEIVINLIGAEKFGVFLFDPGSRELECAVAEGLSPEEQHPVRDPGHLFFRVALGGQLYLTPELGEAADGNTPIAIQPLVVADDLVGILVVYRLLVQKKSGFEDIDLELFDLLAGHAATALMSSLLYKRTQRKAATLEGLLGLLKESGHLLDRPVKG